jgi:hypothetical protein
MRAFHGSLCSGEIMQLLTGLLSLVTGLLGSLPIVGPLLTGLLGSLPI